MDKKGVQIFLVLMLGIIGFVLGLALASPTQQVVSESMLNLNCTTNYLVNDTITNQDRAICTQMDLFLPLIIGTIFSMAGMVLGRMAV